MREIERGRNAVMLSYVVCLNYFDVCCWSIYLGMMCELVCRRNKCEEDIVYACI